MDRHSIGEIYTYDEFRVYELLKNDVKNKAVTIVPECGDFGSSYRPDLYAPDGIPSLGLKSKTVIEIKRNLSYASIRNMVYFEKSVTEAPRDFKKGRNKLSFVWYEDLKGKKKEKTEKVFFATRAKCQDWKNERENLIKKAKEDVADGNNALFLGAGVSASAKMPSWNDLLKGLMGEVKLLKPTTLEAFKELNTHVLEECGDSYLIMARYLQTAIKLYDNKQDFSDLIKKYLYNGNNTSLLLTALSRIIQTKKVNEVITYNFDDVLEQNLSMLGLVNSMDYTSISKDAEVRGHNTLPIYHVHGIISKEGPVDTVVFSEEEYHKRYTNAFHWSNVEQLHAMTRMHCFFVGLSMTDPNLRRLLDVAYNMNQTGGTNHYAFLRRTKMEKYCVSNIERSCKYVHVSESLIDQKKQKEIYDLNYRVIEEIFMKLGVRVIWFEEFDDLPNLVAQVFGLSNYKAATDASLLQECENKIVEIKKIEAGVPTRNPLTMTGIDIAVYIAYKSNNEEKYKKAVTEVAEILNELSVRINLDSISTEDKERLQELQKGIPRYNESLSGYGDFYEVWLDFIKNINPSDKDRQE